MKIEVTEANLQEMILEETQKLMQEGILGALGWSLGKGAAAGAAASALGIDATGSAKIGTAVTAADTVYKGVSATKAAASRALGLGSVSTAGAPAVAGGLTMMATTTIAAIGVVIAGYVYNYIAYTAADPDVAFVTRHLSGRQKDELNTQIREYNDAYIGLIQEMRKYIFSGNSNVEGLAEWSPLVKFTPQTPSKSSEYRLLLLLTEINKILTSSAIFSQQKMDPNALNVALNTLLMGNIKEEFAIMRANGTSNRIKFTQNDLQDSIRAFIDNLVNKAVPVNTSLVAGAKLAGGYEEPEVAAGTGTGTGTGTGAVAAAAGTGAIAGGAAGGSRYQPTSQTLDDVISGRGRIKRNDKSIPTGPVGVIQDHLRSAGMKIGSDGYFGPLTEQAVKDFQKSKGLEENGIVDSATLSLLLDVAIDNEVSSIMAGVTMPTTLSLGKLDELSRDLGIPVIKLKEKVDKLRTSSEQQPENEKLKKRLERAEQHLAVRGMRRVARATNKAVRKGKIDVVKENVKSLNTKGLAELVKEALQAMGMTMQIDKDTAAANMREIEKDIKAFMNETEASVPKRTNFLLGSAIRDGYLDTAVWSKLWSTFLSDYFGTYYKEEAIFDYLNDKIVQYLKNYEVITPREEPASKAPTPVAKQLCPDLSKILKGEAVVKKGVYKCPTVKQLQITLNTAGYKVAEDGDFGDDMYKKVRLFQAEHDLETDGIIGKDTLFAMIESEKVVEPSPLLPEPTLSENKTKRVLISIKRKNLK